MSSILAPSCHQPLHPDITGNDIIGGHIISLVFMCSLVSMLSLEFMLGLDSKTGPQIQGVSTICANMVLCDVFD